MADYNSLKATIDANIRANGVQAITGPVLNACLKAMITVLGNGYQLQGSIAQPGDDPSVPDARVAYVASGPGTYTDFGGLVIPDDGHAYMLTWDTQWTAVQLPVPTSAALAALATVVAGKQDQLTFDPSPVSGSLNPVTSGGIFSAIESAKGAAGLAEALLDTDSEGAEQEFSLRKSGGDGGAYFRRLLGNSVVFNQIYTNGNFAQNTDWNVGNQGVLTISNNMARITKTATSSVTYATLGQSPTKPAVAGHKYLLVATVKTVDCKFCFVPSGTSSDGESVAVNCPDWTRVSYVWTCPSSGNKGFQMRVLNPDDPTKDLDLSVKDAICFDLTEIFGAGNEPTTYAEFYTRYYLPYYNPGKKLIHCKVAKVITKGANQWDEVWELGGYNNTTGAKDSSTDRIRSKNAIPIFPNTAYYFRCPGGATVFVYWYDADGSFISYTSCSNSTLISPANAYSMRFRMTSGYGTTYKNDICINLSDAEINGQYFPYWVRELALDITNQEDTDGNKPFAEGVKSCPVASDEFNEVGGIVRVGVRPYQASDDTDASVITDGVDTAYALTTPVPFTWKEPLNTGIKVSKYGTEEITPAQTENIDNAPFRAVTTYSISVATLVAALHGMGFRGAKNNPEPEPEPEEPKEEPKEEIPVEEPLTR